MPREWSGHLVAMPPPGNNRSHSARVFRGCLTCAFGRICCSFSFAQLTQPQDDGDCTPFLAQLMQPRVDGRRKAVNRAKQEVSDLYTLKHSSMLLTMP